MNMTHLKNAMKSEVVIFRIRYLQIFAWAVQSTFKNFNQTKSEIKFPND